MKTIQWVLTSTAIAALGALPAVADNYDTGNNDSGSYWHNYWTDNSDINTFYRSQEVDVDVFGMGTLGESDINNLTGNKVVHDGRTGAGAGVTGYFCKWVGIGGDVWTEGWDRELASGNLYFRLPIPNTGLAPYAFGGGGYEWNDTGPNQATGDLGGGLELRFMKHLGVFVDARYIFADKTDGFGVGRVGLRLNF